MPKLIELTGFFAGRCEPFVGGFCSYGALIRTDGVITWAAAEGVGQGAKCSVNVARYVGAIACLKQLRRNA
jgi:hypothetical protein